MGGGDDLFTEFFGLPNSDENEPHQNHCDQCRRDHENCPRAEINSTSVIAGKHFESGDIVYRTGDRAAAANTSGYRNTDHHALTEVFHAICGFFLSFADTIGHAGQRCAGSNIRHDSRQQAGSKHKEQNDDFAVSTGDFGSESGDAMGDTGTLECYRDGECTHAECHEGNADALKCGTHTGKAADNTHEAGAEDGGHTRGENVGQG